MRRPKCRYLQRWLDLCLIFFLFLLRWYACRRQLSHRCHRNWVVSTRATNRVQRHLHAIGLCNFLSLELCPWLRSDCSRIVLNFSEKNSSYSGLMAPFKDSPVHNVKFVQEVEKYPCLYNFKLPEYSKKSVTEAAWESIAKETRDTGKR